MGTYLHRSLDLPLHGGKAPRWLLARMIRLSRAILEVMFGLYSPRQVLERLSDPFWFQGLGCVLGFDWHSSGLTTTVCFALKKACSEIPDSPVVVCGGKGRFARQTPEEIRQAGELGSLVSDPEDLVRISKLTAKVDNSCVQDGFTIYHHTMFVGRDGSWAVIQQGMSDDRRAMARRYHWMSSRVSKDFLSDPHAGIVSTGRPALVLNLADSEIEETRDVMVELARQEPSRVIRALSRLQEMGSLPKRHYILLQDIDPRRIHQVLLGTYERQPENFETMLLETKTGAKTLRALALIADLIESKPLSFRDPARYSYAVGGKDGHPYPIERRHYDSVIEELNRLVGQIKTEKGNKRLALKGLLRFARVRA